MVKGDVKINHMDAASIGSSFWLKNYMLFWIKGINIEMKWSWLVLD